MMSIFAAGQAMSAIALTWRGGWQRKARPILCTATLWGVAMATFGFTKNYCVATSGHGIDGWPASPLDHEHDDYIADANEKGHARTRDGRL